MAHDEDGDPLTFDDLWHVGYGVGTMLLHESRVYDGLPELSEQERAVLLDGYDAGARDTECELAARVEVVEPAPLPVGGDEIPF